MKRHGMHGAALAASLFVLGACGGGGSPGAGGGDDGGGSGPIESPALRFSWDEPGMSRGAGGGAVDLPGSATEVVLQAEGSGRRSLGLQAVDGLVAPRLDGVPLMDAMLTESVLTFGDGPAHYTYWDRFDPQWRGRVPQWIAYTEELGRPIYGDPLDGVTPDDPRRPKVLRDAILDGVGDLFFQRDIEGRIRLLWSGALRYCFAAGRPIRALQLQGPDEDRGTVLDAAPGTRIRVSADGAEWSTLWTAAGEGEQRPRVTLPSALVGSPTLCLAFETPSGEAQGFQRLYVRLELEGDDLAALAQFPGGERRIRFEDAPDSSHHARLAWTDPTLTLRVQPPQAGPAPLRVALGDAVLALARSDEGVPGAPARLEVGDLVLWWAAPGQGWGPPARFRVVQGAVPPFTRDWAAYRDAYLADGRWERLWERFETVLEPKGLRFEGQGREGEATVLRWRFEDAAGNAGRMDWLVRPARFTFSGQAFQGIGLRIRASGPALAQATHVQLELPLAVRPGDRALTQRFRALTEVVRDLAGARDYGPEEWLTRHQGFLFRTGPGRTVLAFFDTPPAVTTTLREERGRQVVAMDIALGGGGATRTTPELYWLAAPVGAGDRWAAADAWGTLRDALQARYTAQTGILRARPVPTVVWIEPLKDELEADLRARQSDPKYPRPGEGWLDRLAGELIPRMQAAGVRNLIVQPPWDNDAVHPENPNTSGHAVHDLVVAPLFGGEAALGRLVAAAHEAGLQVTLWYPSALSLFSPLVPKHRDWISWQRIGVPDDGLWGDIVGMDPRAGWNAYAIGKLRDLHAAVPFDGLWLDSWPSLSRIDYANPVPQPVLPASIELLAAFSALPVEDLGIEGTGLLGRSELYGDYETPAGPPHPSPEQVRQHERLRGHEYMLLRGNAGTYLDLPMYHRALAAGGMVNIANMDEVDALGAADRDWLRRINLEHRKVVDRMDHRRLLVQDGRWQGVAWTDEESGDVVLFAFEALTLELGARGTAADVSTGAQTTFDGTFTAQPWRTYVLRGAP